MIGGLNRQSTFQLGILKTKTKIAKTVQSEQKETSKEDNESLYKNKQTIGSAGKFDQLDGY